MPRPVSVFFDHQGKFDCPVCGKSLIRAHLQGWFWHCLKCDRQFALYELKPKVEEAEKIVSDRPEGFFDRVKKVFTGGKNG